MVVVVTTAKKVRSTRPGLLHRDSGSLTTMQVDSGNGKSTSYSSLKSNSSRDNNSSSNANNGSRRRTVSFACDYSDGNDQVHLCPFSPMSEGEIQRSFYSVSYIICLHACMMVVLAVRGCNAKKQRCKEPKTVDSECAAVRSSYFWLFVFLCRSFLSSCLLPVYIGTQKSDLEKFDKDRSLTILMHKTQKHNGVAWDDNVHSLRGLEEVLNQRKGDKSRRRRRQDHIQAVLSEQEKFQTDEGRQELTAPARTIKKSEADLYVELLRGISCSHSKADKARALALAQKDERAAGATPSALHGGSARTLMMNIKSKISVWTTTSSRSLGDRSVRSEREED
jgi:hypothetical protein